MSRWSKPLFEALTFRNNPVIALIDAVRAHRKRSGDNEFEQAIVRVALGLLLIALFGYLNGLGLRPSGIHTEIVVVLAGFLLVSMGIAANILAKPGNVPARRVCVILLDVGTLTYLLLIGAEHSAPLYFFYLWIIIGYGFRFGRAYLFVALGITLAGFGLVIAIAPYWHDELGLSLGLWLGTLLISIYFSVLVGRLFGALEQANIANAAKRQFICAVSHELRTPLNAMIGMLDLLKTTRINSEQEEMLDCMTTTSQVMLSQIEDVLDFSKIEADKMSVERVDFDIYRLAHNIHAMFRYRVDPLATEWLLQIDSDVPVMLNGDPHHLRQILVNLVGNAVKFTEQGRVALRLRRLASSDADVKLLFSVADTGIGIAKEVHGRIFESFTQADESIARRYGGTGLGTTICKQLVELMGGRIGFCSEPGKGSEFWFELNFGPAISQQPLIQTPPIDMHLMLIGSVKEFPALATDIARGCRRVPVAVDSIDAAIDALAQARLAGNPVALTFVEVRWWPEQSTADWAISISDTLQSLRAAARDFVTVFVLLVPSQMPAALAKELAESAGFFATLSVGYQPVALSRLMLAAALSCGEAVRIAITSASEPPVAASASQLRPVLTTDGLEVMIVEDNPTNRRVLQMILERAGHRCVLARDGEEGLELIAKHPVDAIVLDMNMPSVHGTEVARLCRLMGGRPAATPIIMFSANVTPEAREECLSAGANAFVPKPIQVESFLHTLEELAGPHRTLPKSTVLAPVIVDDAGSHCSAHAEAILDLQILKNLETVSKDPAFLDDLITEYRTDSWRLLQRLAQGIENESDHEIKEVLHALRGSALSIGATSMKIICKRFECLSPCGMKEKKNDILRELNQAFVKLCKELEIYQQQRLPAEQAPSGPD